MPGDSSFQEALRRLRSAASSALTIAEISEGPRNDPETMCAIRAIKADAEQIADDWHVSRH